MFSFTLGILSIIVVNHPTLLFNSNSLIHSINLLNDHLVNNNQHQALGSLLHSERERDPQVILGLNKQFNGGITSHCIQTDLCEHLEAGIVLHLCISRYFVGTQLHFCQIKLNRILECWTWKCNV